ncbi:MAG: DUF2911 domain-containing protein [Ferruginibacter sp.]
MKHLLTVMYFLFTCLASFAQVKIIPLDKSPLDVCYFPENYPMLKIQGKAYDPLLARLIYSRPSKGNRVVFGELIAYGKLWRLGANEATEIEFFQNVKIDNEKLKKGRYTVYTIPEANKWTIIFNKENDTWGSFGYDAKKDVAKITVPVQTVSDSVEVFTISLDKISSGFNMNIAWDNTKVNLPIYLQ